MESDTRWGRVEGTGVLRDFPPEQVAQALTHYDAFVDCAAEAGVGVEALFDSSDESVEHNWYLQRLLGWVEGAAESRGLSVGAVVAELCALRERLGPDPELE